MLTASLHTAGIPYFAAEVYNHRRRSAVSNQRPAIEMEIWDKVTKIPSRSLIAMAGILKTNSWTLACEKPRIQSEVKAETSVL